MSGLPHPPGEFRQHQRRGRRWLGWIILITGLVLAGVPALTGVVVANRLSTALAEPVRVGSGELRLLALEQGLWRSQVRYELSWPLGNGERVRLALDQDIQHGPWSMRAGLVALASTLRVAEAVIERDGVAHAPPRYLPLQFTLDARLGYNGVAHATLQMDALDLPLGPVSVAVDDAALSLRYALVGGALDAHLSTQQLALRQGGAPTVRMEQVQHTLSAQLDAQHLALDWQGAAKALALWGQAIGPLQQALTLQEVNSVALSEALRGRSEAWADALPTSARLTGELLGVRHPAGAVSLRVERSTAEMDSTVETGNTPGPGLQLHFVLPKAVVLAAVAAPAGLAALATPGSPAGRIADQQAQMVYALISGQVLATGLVQQGQEGLRADLKLSATGVEVNGETHDWPRFRSRFFPDAP